MLLCKEGHNKSSSLGISERYSEGVNVKLLLRLNDNIKDGDKLWTSLGSPEFISGWFTVDNSDENSEEFPVRLLKVVSLGLFDITILGLAYYFKI